MQGQLRNACGAFLPLALEAMVQIAFLTAVTAHDIDGGVAKVTECIFGAGISGSGDLTDEAGLGPVAVCGNDKPFASVCGEVIPNSDFYDYETKFVNDKSVCLAPAPMDEAISENIRALAIEVYKALGCSGLSRVDFFLTENGAFLNEINTIPGFTPISMYPKMMACIGIEYKDLITKLLSLAEGCEE